MHTKPLMSPLDQSLSAPGKIKRGGLMDAVNFSAFLPADNEKKTIIGNSAPGLPINRNFGSMDQVAQQGAFPQSQTRAITASSPVRMRARGASESTELLQGLGLPLNTRDLVKLMSKKPLDSSSAETALRVKANRGNASIRDRTAEAVARKMKESLGSLNATQASAGTELGRLAARFESGSEGIAAVGYDRHGGTSYGKYQISSRAGTMRSFINYAKSEAPDIALRLEKAGPFNTGGKKGKMPQVWKQVAEEDPARFESLQDQFIKASHFEPTMQAIAEKSGIAADEMPLALREVVFSTAVQHGPVGASRIIGRALDQVGEEKLKAGESSTASLINTQESLIRKIYADRSGQFRSSTKPVQEAVKTRLKEEMRVAIAMLRQEYARG